MSKNKIKRAVAKDELARLSEALDKPYILIGGLAVQQYILTRKSVDIDLVCDFDTVQEILGKLFPMKDWYRHDKNDDDYRPTYVIAHRYEPIGEIIFGPKVLERGGYNLLDWDQLAQDARPFLHNNKPLKNILVPSAHALAYSKLISFIGREEQYAEKLTQDLRRPHEQ